MAEEQENKIPGITDPEAARLNSEVGSIIGTPNPGGEPAFKKSTSSISPLRTYKADYSDLVKNKNLGQIDIVAAEMKRGYGSSADENSEFGQKKGVNPLILILVLAAMGIAGYLVYLILGLNVPALTPKQKAQIPTPLIFSEKQENIILKDASRNELSGELKRTLQKPFPRNNIVYLPLIKDEETKETYIDLKTLLSLLRFDLPVNLTESLENSYMMGLYSKNERYPILILKIKRYEDAFAGMISWENSMATDLSTIWPIKKTTGSDIFKDKTVSNHDIRELNDSEGNLVLMYSFLDKKTLAISTNEEALKAIFERFTFR